VTPKGVVKRKPEPREQAARSPREPVASQRVQRSPPRRRLYEGSQTAAPIGPQAVESASEPVQGGGSVSGIGQGVPCALPITQLAGQPRDSSEEGERLRVYGTDEEERLVNDRGVGEPSDAPEASGETDSFDEDTELLRCQAELVEAAADIGTTSADDELFTTDPDLDDDEDRTTALLMAHPEPSWRRASVSHVVIEEDDEDISSGLDDDHTGFEVDCSEIRGRLWAQSLLRLQRSIDEIYSLCEFESDEMLCEQVWKILGTASHDFSALMQQFEKQQEYALLPSEFPFKSGVAWTTRTPKVATRSGSESAVEVLERAQLASPQGSSSGRNSKEMMRLAKGGSEKRRASSCDPNTSKNRTINGWDEPAEAEETGGGTGEAGTRHRDSSREEQLQIMVQSALHRIQSRLGRPSRPNPEELSKRSEDRQRRAQQLRAHQDDQRMNQLKQTGDRALAARERRQQREQEKQCHLLEKMTCARRQYQDQLRIIWQRARNENRKTAEVAYITKEATKMNSEAVILRHKQDNARLARALLREQMRKKFIESANRVAKVGENRRKQQEMWQSRVLQDLEEKDRLASQRRQEHIDSIKLKSHEQESRSELVRGKRRELQEEEERSSQDFMRFKGKSIGRLAMNVEGLPEGAREEVAEQLQAAVPQPSPSTSSLSRTQKTSHKARQFVRYGTPPPVGATAATEGRSPTGAKFSPKSPMGATPPPSSDTTEQPADEVPLVPELLGCGLPEGLHSLAGSQPEPQQEEHLGSQVDLSRSTWTEERKTRTRKAREKQRKAVTVGGATGSTSTAVTNAAEESSATTDEGDGDDGGAEVDDQASDLEVEEEEDAPLLAEAADIGDPTALPIAAAGKAARAVTGSSSTRQAKFGPKRKAQVESKDAAKSRRGSGPDAAEIGQGADGEHRGVVATPVVQTGALQQRSSLALSSSKPMPVARVRHLETLRSQLGSAALIDDDALKISREVDGNKAPLVTAAHRARISKLATDLGRVLGLLGNPSGGGSVEESSSPSIDLERADAVLADFCKILGQSQREADYFLVLELGCAKTVIEICTRMKDSIGAPSGATEQRSVSLPRRQRSNVMLSALKWLGLLSKQKFARVFILLTNRAVLLADVAMACLDAHLKASVLLPETQSMSCLFLPQVLHVLSLLAKQTLPDDATDRRQTLISYLLVCGLSEQLRDLFRGAGTRGMKLFDGASPVPLLLLRAMCFLGILVGAYRLPVLDVEATCEETSPVVQVLRQTELFGIVSVLSSILLSEKGKQQQLPQTVTSLCLQAVRILNHVARLHLATLQETLSTCRHELYHLFVCLLDYCASRQNAKPGQCQDESELLHETIMLLGYYCLLRSEHQGIMCYGEGQSLLAKITSLPLHYFMDDRGRLVLFPTIFATCFRSPQNLEQLRNEMNLSLLRTYLSTHSAQLAATPALDSEGGIAGAGSGRFPPALWQEALEFFTD